MTSLLGRRRKTFQFHKAARTRHSVQSQSRTLAPVTERRLCLLIVSPRTHVARVGESDVFLAVFQDGQQLSIFYLEHLTVPSSLGVA